MNVRSHFFAYINKIRWVQRWGLKRNTIPENVMEHSWDVATICHALALIRNRFYGGSIDPCRLATAALYHDVSEVITGDMPTPIKYHSTDIRDAYKSIERAAGAELINLLPAELQDDFAEVMLEDNLPEDYRQLIKAADTLSAYLKCQVELKAGNGEFDQAKRYVEARLKEAALPEVDYFLEIFAPSYQLTLDELMNDGNIEPHEPFVLKGE
ncbi:5'-deoxynucleotidase [Motiliproteus sp. MSK22-1]|uniref:5'-deoxynucleotidase n=1 Tax=Motiliproteus sp. MSK22-1 TaxID=1897630 RepID=UPI0009789FCF|nr:5'-deoxynucleotidase [Motiliproteus sp. MSK22-1]OMH38069.1 5'-deoxynucleotidase [Motiliproteus sp. MSK22-1]